ncbi:1,4-alpha-glucan branching enzyme [Gilliamella sp. wkB178]|uniref:1,4-alpha-glucan branching protein GlgB n=1 Tax=Gilliamella sp. wkB178 TaxID=3120259 RepID=UPI00080D9B2D|nr:1,4-alpha-glucan branching protein GlgB [Gilliamella apicola]OCG07801.1 1,4-alpha-glucan branching enzyme [Gilliamella apicola]
MQYSFTQEIRNLINGQCRDPFSILGMHECSLGLEVRVFIPNAQRIILLSKYPSKPILELSPTTNNGFFIGVLSGIKEKFAYQLDIYWENYHEVRDDPYSFWFWLQELDVWLLKQGKHLRAYEKLGAHPFKIGDTEGVIFAVWAPNAKRVSVVGDFNFWDGRQHPMRLRQETGVWELFIPQVKVKQLYKYELITSQNKTVLKADPYAFGTEIRPNTASRVEAFPKPPMSDTTFKIANNFNKPISIYEVHLGSWKRHQDNSWLSYRELADELLPYVKDMGFTHLELLPIMEHPFDGSWGYQPIGLFSPTSRFGSPDDFAYFLQTARDQGIHIILDWVPGHFPEDEHGLRQFDGTTLYEYPNPKEGMHLDWNTLVYNYSRFEVRNYLISNALYWLDVYGVDGFRFDAVASMIYRDYSRKSGDWIPNKFGGRENLEAISFLQEVNHDIGQYYPGCITIAEESTDYPCVTKPPENNGLGFHYKWNMGWMHDTLNYLKLDPIYRKYHHNLITFGLTYAYSENFILPLSHDEVVYGKCSILNKMSGDTWQKFANLRAYYAFMWAYPGKKLLFMGSEFGQWNEWNHDSQLDWYLVTEGKNNLHQGVSQLITDLNNIYRQNPALYELDYQAAGFNWLVVDDNQNSIFVFERIDNQGNRIIVLSNYTPVVHYNYQFGVSESGKYQEILNTDSIYYGGSNVGNLGSIVTQKVASHGKPYSLIVTVPPLATLYLVRA